MRSGMSQDYAQYQPGETTQHVSMLRHAKAQLEHSKCNDFRSMQSLYISEKETTAGVHKSCQNSRRDTADVTYSKCKQTHPQFYFNNLGILHLRFRKYALAQFQFSKALKFLECAQTTTQQVPGSTTVWGENFTQPAQASPHTATSNTHGQKSIEVLFNMGLACYKDRKYEQAFRLFEKVSHAQKSNPQLWYYMGLSVMHFNLQKQSAQARASETDTYTHKGGYTVEFELKNQGTLKRLQMAPKGDQLSILSQLVSASEQEYTDRLKATQTEITKNRLKQIASNMSKAQLKKQEKAAQQAWQVTNCPKDAMQLSAALQYFMNA